MMFRAASLIACRLDAQLRLIVTPPVSMGNSAEHKAMRAISKALLALLLHAAPADVVDQVRLDARAGDERFDM